MKTHPSLHPHLSGDILIQDPGDGSTADSGLGTITMEKEDAEADTAGNKEVKGGYGEDTRDATLNADVTDDLAWNDNDPYIKIDDESSGVNRTPVAASVPLSMTIEETILTPCASKH